MEKVTSRMKVVGEETTGDDSRSNSRGGSSVRQEREKARAATGGGMREKGSGNTRTHVVGHAIHTT